MTFHFLGFIVTMLATARSVLFSSTSFNSVAHLFKYFPFFLGLQKSYVIQPSSVDVFGVAVKLVQLGLGIWALLFQALLCPTVVSYPSGKRKFSSTSPASDKTTAENSYSLQCCQSEKQYKDINIEENSFLSGIHCDCCSSLLFLQC